eukprot:UN26901
MDIKFDDVPYDVIILGTGLVQSITASALAVSGKKVVHIDFNREYGEFDSTPSLRDFKEMAVAEDTSESLPEEDDCIIMPSAKKLPVRNLEIQFPVKDLLLQLEEEQRIKVEEWERKNAEEEAKLAKEAEENDKEEGDSVPKDSEDLIKADDSKKNNSQPNISEKPLENPLLIAMRSLAETIEKQKRNIFARFSSKRPFCFWTDCRSSFKLKRWKIPRI